MKKFLKSFARFLAYSVFFLGALLFFVYLTLPIEEARSFLVRKASDEYNADLVFADEDSLGVCGLACVEARNVTFTIRPTPEELAKYQEEQRAWKEWKEAETGAKAEAPAAEGEALPSDEAKAAPSVAGESAPEVAPGTAGPEGLGAPLDAVEKPEKSVKSVAVASKAPPPKKPEWPAEPIELASLRAELSPFKIMTGLLEGRLQAELLGGTLDAEVSQTNEEMKIKGTLSDLDVAQLSVLERLVPLPIAGVVAIDLDLTVELDDEKKPKLDLITGTATLHVRNAFVGPGQIESKKLGAFPYFDVPRTRIEDVGGRLVFEKRKATFEDFAIRGQDLEGEITGHIQLAADLSRWSSRGHLRFKFSDAFLEQHKDVKTALTNIAYLKKGQSEGYTGFGVTGEFGKLKWTPTKTSPYKGRVRGEPRADKADKETGDGEETAGKRPTALDRTAKSRPDRLRRALEKTNEKAEEDVGKPTHLDRPVPAPEVTSGRKPYIRPPTMVPDTMPMPEVPEEPAEEPEEDTSPTVVPEADTEEPAGAVEEPEAAEPGSEVEEPEGTEGGEETP